MTMQKVLHSKNVIDYMCPEKKEDEESQSLKKAWMRRFEDCMKKSKERIITATKNSTGDIKINRRRIIRKQKWE